jgi:two-component system LytT family sensor kinase
MKSVRQWVLLFAALTVVALLFASQIYVAFRTESMRVPFRAILLPLICLWYLWAVAGPLAWSFATRWPIRAEHKMKNAVRHAALAIAVSAGVLGAFVSVYQMLLQIPMTASWLLITNRPRPWTTNVVFFFSAYFHFELLVYGTVVAVAHAVRSSSELRTREREALELNSQLTTARLQVLTAQLQPHFLFNTLHTVGSLIVQRNSDRAMQILAELGDLLRMTLERQDARLIPLADELEHLKRYLRIEETRFADRLTVDWQIDPGALDALVPPLILQPIVENALKHGVAKRVEHSRVVVRAGLADGRLRVSVYNDGPQLANEWSAESSLGFGLRNVRDRLATGGIGGTLAIDNVGPAGVRATIELPARLAAGRHG